MFEKLISGGLTDGVQEMLSSVIASLPTFFGALAILVVGIIISKFVAKIVKKVLSKIGIDKLGEQLNEIDLIQKMNADIKISSIFSKIVYYFLLMIFIIAATDVLNMSAISEMVMNAFNLIPKIVVGLVILIFGTLLSDSIKNLVLAALNSLGIPSAKLIASFLFYFLFINVVISAIAQADINTAFLEQNLSIIIGGIAVAFAIGYGLASKDVVSNFLGSFYAEGKVKIGDKITYNGITGTVEDIDRNTLLLKTENSEVIIPLGVFMKNTIEKHTK